MRTACNKHGAIYVYRVQLANPVRKKNLTVRMYK